MIARTFPRAGLALIAGVAASIAVASGKPAQAVPSFEVIDLGILQTGIGGFFSEGVSSLNDNGLVVGFLFDGTQNIFTPALWDLNVSTVPTPLVGLTGDSRAASVNNNGDIVGSGRNANSIIDTGFVNSPDGNGLRVTQEIGVLGTGGSRAFAINDQGRITGGADDGVNPQEAFVTDDIQTIQQLGILNDNGDSFARDVAESGKAVGVSGGQAVLFDNPQIDLLDTTSIFTSSDAAALNETDEVVGTGRLAGNVRHAFYFDPLVGSMQDLGAMADDSRAADINNSSQIVGTTDLFAGFNATGGFLFEADGDQQMFLLNDLLDSNDPLGELTNVRQAVAINDLGQVLALGTRLVKQSEGEGEDGEDTFFFTDTGEFHGYVLTPTGGGGDGDDGDDLPAPEIFVEASARHGDDDAGTQSLTAESGILAIELAREQVPGDFPGFDETRGRAEGLITNVGVPTVGSLSISGGDTGLFTACDPLNEACIATKESTATSRVISHLQPLFADPDAAPDSIDLDLLLNIDGILDIGWFFEEVNSAEPSAALAETTVTAKLHTEDGTIVLFEGSARLARDGVDGADLEFFDDWEDFAENGFTIVDDSFFEDVPNQELEATFGATDVTIRDDPIRTATEFIQVQTAFEDIAFLSPGETFALELEIFTHALSEKLNFFGQLPEDFKNCFLAGSCDLEDILATDFDDFVIDHSFALADMLNTVTATSTSNTDGVTFIAVDVNGDPLPAVGVPAPPSLMLFGAGLFGLGAFALRRRRQLNWLTKAGKARRS